MYTACTKRQEKSTVAKLSEEARMSIEVLTDQGVSNREVARLLGVSEGCVRYHRRRQRWHPRANRHQAVGRWRRCNGRRPSKSKGSKSKGSVIDFS
ncbi:MAG TPA: hypothetical protein ENJ24_04115 [Gammaproteobacteria bacterium]|nr:hypothetical protein [Gammaproteobacteria bacterium]